MLPLRLCSRGEVENLGRAEASRALPPADSVPAHRPPPTVLDAGTTAKELRCLHPPPSPAGSPSWLGGWQTSVRPTCGGASSASAATAPSTRSPTTWTGPQSGRRSSTMSSPRPSTSACGSCDVPAWSLTALPRATCTEPPDSQLARRQRRDLSGRQASGRPTCDDHSGGGCRAVESPGHVLVGVARGLAPCPPFLDRTTACGCPELSRW